MVVKVFGTGKSACTQRVLACLFEKDVDFELVNVDLQTGEHKRPEFLLKQPFGQVPAIEDGELKLFESRAIVRYYAAKYANIGAEIQGKTLEEKATVDQWVEVEAHNFNELVYTLVLHLLIFPKTGQPGDLNLVNNAVQRLEKVFDIYEERLSKSKYLAGNWFSLADLTHLPAIRYLVTDLGLARLVMKRPSVNEWWLDISSRPAWKKVVMLVN